MEAVFVTRNIQQILGLGLHGIACTILRNIVTKKPHVNAFEPLNKEIAKLTLPQFEVIWSDAKLLIKTN